jgi:ribonuclease P protein component
MSLPKANRLRQRRDFQKVFNRGIRRQSPHLTMRAISDELKENDRQKPSCFGISISQKVSKKAVVRNRIKRQIKSAIRQLLPQIKTDWKIAIVVKPSAVECKYEHFLRELEELFLKAEVIDGHSRGRLL